MRKEEQSSQARAARTSERACAHPPDVAEVEHFLTLLDPDADTFIFARGDDDKERRKRLIAEAKADGRAAPTLWEHRRGSHVNTQQWLQERQAAGWGSFVSVQAMRGAKCRNGDVAYIRAVYAEMDIGDPLEPWPLEPSLIVESSPGRFHVYWLVSAEDPINGDEFNGIEMCLVETYGSDPDCKDLARRLRLPGTWNVKPGRPPHLVKLIHESGARYSKGELLKAFPAPRRRKPTSPKKRPLMGEPGRGLDRFVGQHQDGPLWSISPDDYGPWLKVGMALHAETNGSANGQRLWDAWSAKSEKWSPGACADKWKSFSGSRGITGGTIYAMAEERGWVRMKVAPVVQKIAGGAQARRHAPGHGEATRPPEPPRNDMRDKRLTTDDFYGDMESGEFICPATMGLWPAKSVNARVPPVKTGEVDETGKPKTIKASAWIAAHRPVDQMSWVPGKPMIVENAVMTEGGLIDVPGRTLFNLYRPPMIKLGDARQAGKWLEHVKRLYPSEWEHIVRWFALRVQRPDVKINHGLVLGGAPGIGKDSMLYPVGRAIGPWNMEEIKPYQLMERFNGYQKSVILRVSEAHDLGELDRYALHERTKTLLAAPPETLKVNEKNRREYRVPNVTGPVITTNHRTDSLYLPPDDRRHLVAWSEVPPEAFPPEYYASLYGWYDRQGGCEHVAAYLTTLDVEDFSPTAPPPKTDAFWAIVHAERSAEDAQLADVLDRLGRPVALTIPILTVSAEGSLLDLLRERKGAAVRRVGHMLEGAGYLAVSNDETKDGFYEVNKQRVRVYALRSLSPAQRKSVAVALARCNGRLAELAPWAAANGARSPC